MRLYSLSITKSISIYFVLLLGVYTPITAQINWTPREDLNILLPESVRVFETNGYWEDAAPYRAMYTRIDLTDENLKLRALGSNTRRETTKETYENNNGILAINGGYFASDYSVSLLISDGEVISPGKYHDRPRAAFGMLKGEPQIFWSNSENLDSPALLYSTTDITGVGQPIQTNLAVGAGPMLLKQGDVQVSSEEEGFGGSHLVRHPRTAIGYANKNTLIMMVVDGRQLSSSGATLPELAQMMKSTGAIEAMNLDGGGSSAMIAAGEVVNIPSDIPGGNRNSLRNNASAMVLSENISTPIPETYFFDTDNKQYREIGLWKDTNLANHYDSTSSRQAATTEYNKALYSFSDISQKEYQLGAWWPVHDQNSQDVRYVIHHTHSSDTISVDQSDLATSGKWNILGTYLLGSGDSMEILGGGDPEGKMQADAIRLVETQNSPELPVRGDLRLAVISDLNSGLGAADYQWQVDSIIQRIPRLWNPDLVVSGGDMVAGMGISDTTHLRRMWEGFEKHIGGPLREAGIPFAFTLGNHDGPRSYPLERKVAQEFWNRPESDPGIEFVDREFFPNYYSFVQDQAFFVSWEASSSKITEENLEWMKTQFERPEAKNAKYRFVVGHMPLYSVAQERDSRGNVLDQPERLQRLLEQYKVHTYISGHQHAYYPGKRGTLQLLNTGAAGSGARAWLTLDRAPTNTITIMDIFYEQDSIAYTTYEIKEPEARDMKLFDDSVLPSAMFGVNGHQIRRDIPVADSTRGLFFPTKSYGQQSQYGEGQAEAILRNNQLNISGHISNIEGRVSKENGLTLQVGRNTEEGKILFDLTESVKGRKKGRFKASISVSDLLEALDNHIGTIAPEKTVKSPSSAASSLTNIQELLAVGALHLQFKTESDSLRAQLLPEENSTPSAPKIVSHKTRNLYAVRDLEAMYTIEWEASKDCDGDFVAYTYQVARDQDFKELVVNEYTGRTTGSKKTEEYWFNLLGDAKIGQPVQLYHRVVATDGRNTSASPGESLRLFKSEEPLDDLIEVPAPEFTFTGKIAEGAGYGAEWDAEGKLWLADYRGSLIVKNADGSDASFSPLRSVNIKGETFSLSPLNGIGVDLEGNILVGRNRHLLKIDSKTGEGLAVWEVPKGHRAITSPRVNNKGEIYAASLFGEDPVYVLRHNSEGTGGFELARTIELDKRLLSRTFDMSEDGMTLYFPDPGSPVIQRYSSKDGETYTLAEKIGSTSSGSSGLHIDHDGSLYAAVRSSGIKPSTLHFRNEQTQRMWTLELPEVDGAEPRGIGVSTDGKTIIFCSWDKGGGYYRYELQE